MIQTTKKNEKTTPKTPYFITCEDCEDGRYRNQQSYVLFVTSDTFVMISDYNVCM